MSEILQSEPWKAQSGGRRYTQHIGVGADADVNGTGQFNSLLQDIFGVNTNSTVSFIQETMTGSPPTYSTGLHIKIGSNYSSGFTSLMGIEALAATVSGNTQGGVLMAGFFGGAIHRGTGTVSQAYGVPGISQLASSGNISIAYGLYGTVTNSGSGTISQAAGLYLAANSNSGGGSITNSYNMVSAGLATRNYFEGFIETHAAGGFYLGTTGSVNNRFLLNAYLASDSTAEQINTPSSTARKALVLQMNTSQSANAFEVQDSSATPLAYFTPTGLLALPDGSASTPGLTNVGDTNTGLYFPAADNVGVATAGVLQATFMDMTASPYTLLELAPTNRDIAFSSSVIGAFLRVDNTYTTTAANSVAPVGYDWNPTVIFATNGYGIGSEFLFWARPTITNDSGSTRTVGPTGGYVDQHTVQANGGTLTLGAHFGFLGQPTFNRINSGTMNVTYVTEFYSNGATIGAGTTVTAYNHFAIADITNSGTVTTQVGYGVPSLTGATNNTHILIGTATTGSWGIYQSTTTDNYLGGSLQLARRLKKAQGADIASANNLTLGSDGNMFEITGTTQINLISNVSWQNGSQVTLLFTSTPTVKHNQTTSGTDITVQLAGAADFVASAGDTLTLVLSEIGGTQAWREVSRAVI